MQEFNTVASVSGGYNFTSSGSFTQMGTASTFNNNSAGLLTFSNNVYLSNLQSAGYTLTLGGAGNILISGVISNYNGQSVNAPGAGGSLVYSGAGQLTLSGSNTFTGGMTLASGQLNLNSVGALPATGLTISGNSSIDNTSGAAITLNSSPAITLGANVNFMGSNNLNLGAGAVSLSGSRTIFLGNQGSAPSTLTMAGAVTNTANSAITTTVVGAGNTLVLGSLNLGNTSSETSTFTGNGNINITGPVADGTQSYVTYSTLAYTGSGTMNLQGANTFTGGLTVTGGTVNVTGSLASGLSQFTLGGGGTLNYNPAIAGAQSVNYSYLYSGNSNIVLGAAGDTLNLGNLFRSNTGAVINFPTTGTVTTSAGNDSSGVIGAWATIGSGTNLAYAVSNGATSAITPYAAATPATATNMTSSSTSFSYGAGGTLTPTSSATVDTLQITGSAATTLSTASGSFTFNGLMSDSTALTTISGSANPVYLGAGNADGVITGPGSITISSVVAGQALTMAGTGTLTLSGTNTYSGGTYLNSGTINFGADLNLGAAPGSATPGNLTFSGGTLQDTATITLNANRGILLQGNGGTISVNNGATLTYGGLMAGSAPLNFTGPGTFSETAAAGMAALTGPVNVLAGTLNYQLAAATAQNNPFGAGPLTLGAASSATSATLNLSNNGASDTVTSPLIVASGNTGTLKITDPSGQIWNFSGPAYLGSNLTVVNSNGAANSIFELSGVTTGTGSLTLQGTGAGSPFTIAGFYNTSSSIINTGTNASGVVTISGTLGPLVAGLLQNSSTAPMTISASQPYYAGTTTVTAGTFNANALNAVGSGSVLVNGGALAESTANALSSTASLAVSSGSATLSQANNYTGPTTISSTGTLNLSGVGASSASAIGVSGGALNITGSSGVTGGSITATGGVINIANGATGFATAANVPIALNGGELITPASTIGSPAGAIGGTLTVGSGGVVFPGNGAVGQLNVANLSAAAGSALEFSTTTPWTSVPATTGSLLDVTGAFTAAAGTKLTFLSSPVAAGDYRLIEYAGTAPTLSNFTLPAAPAGLNYALSTSADLGYIDLVVTNSSYTAANSTWALSGGGTWNSTASWTPAVIPTISGDAATFGASIGNTNATVTLDANQHVGSLTFNNSGTGVYTLANGSSGTNTLYLDNGASSASVTNSTNNNVISAPVNFYSSNSNFNIAEGTTLSMSGAITGTGGLTMTTGAGALSLSGANSFTGPINLNAGVLTFPTASSVASWGNAGAATFNMNGGTVNLSAATGATTLSSGALFNFGTNGGTIIASGAGTTGKLIDSTAYSLAGSGTLIKAGGADLLINVPNYNPTTTSGFTGNVTIQGGYVELQNILGLGNGGTVTVSGVAATAGATGNLTVGSELVTLAAGATSGLLVGQAVSGTGIPAGAYITEITSGTTFDISAPVTTAGSAVALTLPATNGEFVGSTTAGYISNPIVFSGVGGIVSANATGTIFTGSVSVPASGTFTVAPRLFQTTTTGSNVIMAGAITGGASLSLGTITESSLGNVILGGSNTNWTTNQGTSGNPFVMSSAFQGLEFGPNARPNAANGVNVTLSGGAFGIVSDGDGTGNPNNAGTFTDTFNMTVSSTLEVGRIGAGVPVGSYLYNTPTNKQVAESNNFTLGAYTLTVSNSNGYGLDFTGGMTLNGTDPILKVSTGTYSDQTYGLTIDGTVSSGGMLPRPMERSSWRSRAATSP